jgi:hypothetical protein
MLVRFKNGDGFHILSKSLHGKDENRWKAEEPLE